MANTSISSNPAAAFSEAARFGEIRSRFFFLIGALVVYRIGTFIPVPGVNPAEVARFFNDQSNTIFGVLIMVVLSNALNLLNVNSYWQRIAIGSVIAAAAVVDQSRHRRS